MFIYRFFSSFTGNFWFNIYLLNKLLDLKMPYTITNGVVDLGSQSAKRFTEFNREGRQ
jgi:hypothetical protein